MDASQSFLVRHGYVTLFGLIFVDQLGAPVPGVPFLLGAGALVASGQLGFAAALAVAVAASFAADAVWFALGRSRGPPSMRFLCRVALEPDVCVRRAETFFERHGARALLLAKFIPGVDLMAPPIAGMVGMSFRRFALLDAIGAAIWAALFLGLGAALHGQIASVTDWFERLGTPLSVGVAGVIVLYAGWKWAARRRLIRHLRTQRVHPDEVARRLAAKEPLFIVDLRQNLDFAADPRTLPGARRISVEELESRHVEIPRDRDVVLYCT
jgi:membrane protein DedA with SNARE-associated domain